MKRPKFVLYKAADGYRWRLVAANGRIVADSGEAYTRKPDAHRAVYTVKEILLGMERERAMAARHAGYMAACRISGVEVSR